MPEFISAVLTSKLFGFRASSKKSPGVSAEAEVVYARIEQVSDNAEKAFSYLSERNGVIANLNSLVIECLMSEADGRESPPVSFPSYRNAKEFISLLPANLPDPEVAIEPNDGAISLEWYFGYRKLFAVSIGNTKRFAFAGLNGTDKMYGVSQFEEESGAVPQTLVNGVRLVAG